METQAFYTIAIAGIIVICLLSAIELNSTIKKVRQKFWNKGKTLPHSFHLPTAISLGLATTFICILPNIQIKNSLAGIIIFIMAVMLYWRLYCMKKVMLTKVNP